MATTTRTAPDPSIAANLLRHPGVAAAKVRIAEDGVVEASVLPAPSRGRVPARGRCALIDVSGGVVDAELIDISWAGVCVRVAESGERAPALGAEVQLWIEASALGDGVDGWLGRVRWVRGREVGVEFAGNVDQGAPVLQLVADFERAGPQQPAPCSVEVDRPLRVAFRRKVRLHVGAMALGGQSLDVSVGGIGLELYEDLLLDLRTRDVRVQVDAAGLWETPFPATVVHHDRQRVGLELRADLACARALADISEREARRDEVTPAALEDWLRSLGVRESVRVRRVDVAQGSGA